VGEPQFTPLWAPSWPQSSAPTAPKWVQLTRLEGPQQHPRVGRDEHWVTRVPPQLQCHQTLAWLPPHSPRRCSLCPGVPQPSGHLHPMAAWAHPPPPPGQGRGEGEGGVPSPLPRALSLLGDGRESPCHLVTLRPGATHRYQPWGCCQEAGTRVLQPLQDEAALGPPARWAHGFILPPENSYPAPKTHLGKVGACSPPRKTCRLPLRTPHPTSPAVSQVIY